MNGKDDYKKIPNGAPGIETMLMLLHSEGVVKGRISLERMVDVLSTGTARMFGLADKGVDRGGQGRGHRGLRPEAEVHHGPEEAAPERGLHPLGGLGGDRHARRSCTPAAGAWPSGRGTA